MVTAGTGSWHRTALPRVVAADLTPPQPWRNGGGQTRELLALPTPADWRIRVSLADVTADGPFSAFPGVSRWIAVVAGDGMALDFGHGVRTLRRGDPPLAFDGGAVPACRLLGGPSQDLNLMLREADGAMLAVEPRARWAPAAPACGLFARVAGVCLAHAAASFAVEAHTLLWFAEAPASLAFVPGDAAAPACGWWVRFVPPEGRS